MTCSLLNGLYHVRAGPGGGEGGRLGGSERGGGLRSERGGWSAAAAAAAAAHQQLCGVDQLVRGWGETANHPQLPHSLPRSHPQHTPAGALCPPHPPLPTPPSLSLFFFSSIIHPCLCPGKAAPPHRWEAGGQLRAGVSGREGVRV